MAVAAVEVIGWWSLWRVLLTYRVVEVVEKVVLVVVFEVIEWQLRELGGNNYKSYLITVAR